jgi:protocatechuate 4,5-dioxygenase alpha chain
MSDTRDSPPLPPPGFDLDPPGTYLYSGPLSTRGFRLNRFALSLTKAANRAQFLSDEDAYMAAFDLTEQECALVRARDWTGLLQAGGHLQAMLKLAATLGLNLYHIGAHNIGADAASLYAACPRRVSTIPERG